MKCPVCKTELQDGMTECPNCKFDKFKRSFKDTDDVLNYIKSVVLPYRNKWQETICAEKQQSAAELYMSMMAAQVEMIRNMAPSTVELFEYAINKDNTATVVKYNGEDKNVVIPDRYEGFPVAHIAENVFKGCRSLISVVLPSGLKTIGNNAFRDSSLSKVMIPGSCCTIGAGAFANTEIEEIVFPESVSVISEYVCYNCSKLKTVIILNAKAIEAGAFSRNILTSRGDLKIILPNTLKTLELSAFGNIWIDKLVLPESVTSVIIAPVSMSIHIRNLVVVGDKTAFEIQKGKTGSFALIWTTEAIYCNNGSKAQKFARENNYKVLPLSEFAPSQN